jgi:hypothetical protein
MMLQRQLELELELPLPLPPPPPPLLLRRRSASSLTIVALPAVNSCFHDAINGLERRCQVVRHASRGQRVLVVCRADAASET